MAGTYRMNSRIPLDAAHGREVLDYHNDGIRPGFF